MRQGWALSKLPLRSDLSFPLPPAFRNSRKSTWKHYFLSNCYYLFSLWFPLIGEVLCLLPSKNIWKDCHEHFGTFLLCQHPCLVLCMVWHFFVFIATTKEWVLVSFPFLQMRKVRLQVGPWLVAKISGTKEPGLRNLISWDLCLLLSSVGSWLRPTFHFGFLFSSLFMKSPSFYWRWHALSFLSFPLFDDYYYYMFGAELGISKHELCLEISRSFFCRVSISKALGHRWIHVISLRNSLKKNETVSMFS